MGWPVTIPAAWRCRRRYRRHAAGLVAVSSLAVEGCDAAIGHWANAKIVPWITSDLPNDRFEAGFIGYGGRYEYHRQYRVLASAWVVPFGSTEPCPWRVVAAPSFAQRVGESRRLLVARYRLVAPRSRIRCIKAHLDELTNQGLQFGVDRLAPAILGRATGDGWKRSPGRQPVSMISLMQSAADPAPRDCDPFYRHHQFHRACGDAGTQRPRTAAQ